MNLCIHSLGSDIMRNLLVSCVGWFIARRVRLQHVYQKEYGVVPDDAGQIPCYIYIGSTPNGHSYVQYLCQTTTVVH